MKRAASPPPADERRGFARRFALGVALWLAPVAVVWVLLTPFYNRFLTRAAENLLRLSESPNVTRLAVTRTHYFLITRTDFPPSRGHLSSVRVTDTHFPVVMLGAFFLAVPGVPWRRCLGALGWALLLSALFHVVSLFFWVKFVYATQLGAWSAEHYGPFGQNFWGLGKHLLDLPFKLAWPLVLWAAFYLRRLLPR
jgi:hypothetical protein